MKASNGPLFRAGVVVLDEDVGNPVLPVFDAVIGFEKEAAAVVKDVGLHDEHARQIGLDNVHVAARS
jgi:hypothetical protein